MESITEQLEELKNKKNMLDNKTYRQKLMQLLNKYTGITINDDYVLSDVNKHNNKLEEAYNLTGKKK